MGSRVSESEPNLSNVKRTPAPVRCSSCGELGHNVRGCGAASLRALAGVPGISPTDPVVLALCAHGWTCALCMRALEQHREHPGEIRVFFDLCEDGRAVLKAATSADMIRAIRPGPGRDS